MGAKASRSSPAGPSIAAMRERCPRGMHADLVAHGQHAAGERAGVAAVVVQLGVVGGVGRMTYWTGKPRRLERRVRADGDGLEVLEQRGAGVPGHRAASGRRRCRRAARRSGSRRRRATPRRGEQVAALAHDRVEALLGEVDEVHLVDAHGDVADAEQRRDRGVPARLLDHAVARVDQHDRELRGGGAGDHVARVLHVARACRRG